MGFIRYRYLFSVWMLPLSVFLFFEKKAYLCKKNKK